MTTDTFFKTGFFALFTLLTLIRLYYKARAGLLRQPPPLRAEGPLLLAIRILFGIPLLGAVACYGLGVQGCSWMSVVLPGWLRGVGLAVGSAALVVLWLVHRALGENFTTSVLPKESHVLVRTGPYRWVRHPMYGSYLVLFVAAFLITGNVVIGIAGTAIILSLMTIRLRREEAFLIQRFGEEYLLYSARTPRFFPSLNPRWHVRQPSPVAAESPLAQGWAQEQVLTPDGSPFRCHE